MSVTSTSFNLASKDETSRIKHTSNTATRKNTNRILTTSTLDLQPLEPVIVSKNIPVDQGDYQDKSVT